MAGADLEAVWHPRYAIDGLAKPGAGEATTWRQLELGWVMRTMAR
ncbi:hypothetical protein OG830_39485 [Streptomyces sp. NBC_00121]|nr:MULTISPECIES: hypothetical protein [unclassified Streptomyces]WNO69376.1 hypothetical protein RPQ02_39140 [Streptomyces sp. AM2-3-1]WSC74157.1 hypothetical protein OG807_40160 [Streptomyces sp. NBC_01760]